MNMNSEKDISLLREEFQLLKKSLPHLQGSIGKCSSIEKKSEYSFEELESFDSLTSRFARSADIYSQKVIRTIFAIMREDVRFFADRMYKAEKEGIIASADKLLEIKDLRNDIVHQYIPETTFEIMNDVLKLSVELLKNINWTEMYLSKRNWI
jgi:hypothetical protein